METRYQAKQAADADRQSEPSETEAQPNVARSPAPITMVAWTPGLPWRREPPVWIARDPMRFSGICSK